MSLNELGFGTKIWAGLEMNTMPKLLLAVTALLFTTAASTQDFTLLDKKVDSFITTEMKNNNIPGLAVGVVRNGTIIKMNGYGFANLEWQVPVSVHSNFQIASCSKLLASTLIMKAIYENKIRLEDRVGKYLDSIPQTWQDMRIKNLVTHSSGIKNFAGDPYENLDAVIKSLKDSSLEYQPGRGQHYANFDYTILHYILEGLYGKPYEQILRKEVTDPANMRDGAFDMEKKLGNWMQAELVSQKVTTYYGAPSHLFGYKYIYPRYTYTAGGYFASISDMVNWAVALDKGLLFPKDFSDELIYSRDSLTHHLSAFSNAGWVVDLENNVLFAGHSGGPGLGDILRFPAEGYTIIVLSNDGELQPTFARAIASFYVPALSPKRIILKFKRKP